MTPRGPAEVSPEEVHARGGLPAAAGRPPPRAANQLRAGAALAYVNVAASYVLNLLFTPLMLRSLGQSGFGLYSLVGAFVAYVAVLDFGIGNATIRYVAKFRAERAPETEGAFVALCVRIYCGIAVVALVVGGVVLLNLSALFGRTMSAAELSDARGLWALMVLNVALSFPLGTFNAVIIGHERFVFLRLIGLGRVLVRTGLLVALLLLGHKAFAIVVVDTLLNVVVGVVNIGYVRGRLGVRLHRPRFDARFIREVLSYSALVFVGVLVDALYWRVGHLVLGATVGTSAVAVFSVAMLLANHYRELPLAISGVFLPRITAMVVSGASSNDLLDVFARVARIQLLVLGYVLGGFVLFGREFVNLWAGPEYDAAWSVTLVVLVPLTVPLFQSVGIHILQARNMHGFRSFTYLGVAIANVALSVVLVGRWGPMGAALATAASLAAGNIVAINWYYHRRVGLDMFRFFRRVTSGLAPAMAAAMLVGAAARWPPGFSWPTFAFRGAVFTAAYVSAMWLFGMNEYEKGLFRSAARWLGRSQPAPAR